jgi:UDP-glucose 4-epimerase
MLLDSKYKRILITGGAGFIGSHLCEELLKQKKYVVCMDNFANSGEENIKPFFDNPNFQFVKGDVCKILSDAKLLKNFENIDIVFHQACSKCTVCLENPELDLSVNAWGTYCVLEASRRCHVKKIIHASTGSVYGEPEYFPEDEKHPFKPVSLYGVSKLAGERYYEVFRKMHGLDYVILRYFHVYGNRQKSDEYGGVIPIFIKCAYENKPLVIYGDGSQIRCFTFVEDVVKANILAANCGKTGEAYNCCSGIKVSIHDLAKMILKIMKKENLEIQFRKWRFGDIKYFDVCNRKIKEIGMEFDTDFENKMKQIIKNYEIYFRKRKKKPVHIQIQNNINIHGEETSSYSE